MNLKFWNNLYSYIYICLYLKIYLFLGKLQLSQNIYFSKDYYIYSKIYFLVYYFAVSQTVLFSVFLPICSTAKLSRKTKEIYSRFSGWYFVSTAISILRLHRRISILFFYLAETNQQPNYTISQIFVDFFDTITISISKIKNGELLAKFQFIRIIAFWLNNKNIETIYLY